MYKKGFTKSQISNLYKFIDWLIGLPESLEVEYLNEVYKLEEETKMAYVTFAERYGVEKGIRIGNEQGIEKGIGQGILIVATNLLKDGQNPSYVEKVTGLSQEKIKDLEVTLEKNH